MTKNNSVQIASHRMPVEYKADHCAWCRYHQDNHWPVVLCLSTTHDLPAVLCNTYRAVSIVIVIHYHKQSWSCDLIAVWFDHHHISRLPLSSANCPLQVVSAQLQIQHQQSGQLGKQHEQCPQPSGPFCRPEQRDSPFGAVSAAKVPSVASSKWPVYSQWVCLSV